MKYCNRGCHRSLYTLGANNPGKQTLSYQTFWEKNNVLSSCRTYCVTVFAVWSPELSSACINMCGQQTPVPSPAIDNTADGSESYWYYKTSLYGNKQLKSVNRFYVWWFDVFGVIVIFCWVWNYQTITQSKDIVAREQTGHKDCSLGQNTEEDLGLRIHHMTSWIQLHLKW